MAQTPLFEPPPPDAFAPPGSLRPAAVDAELQALAQRLQQWFAGRLHLGSSSWHFPGWAGLVYEQAWPAKRLSRVGLAAYAQHPLLNTVCLDGAFYRPLDAASYRSLAAQVPAHFRFVVKVPAMLSDASVRDAATGAEFRDNVYFLDAQGAVAPGLPAGAQQALELRDPGLLTPALAATLKGHGARPVLGLHDRMPEAQAQLPLLRATWPGDLVRRWNLQQGQRYAQVRDAWAPFSGLRAPDEATRATLVKVLAATLQAGHAAYVMVNNKAEGCAPASVLALARALDAMSAEASAQPARSAKMAHRKQNRP